MCEHRKIMGSMNAPFVFSVYVAIVFLSESVGIWPTGEGAWENWPKSAKTSIFPSLLPFKNGRRIKTSS